MKSFNQYLKEKINESSTTSYDYNLKKEKNGYLLTYRPAGSNEDWKSKIISKEDIEKLMGTEHGMQVVSDKKMDNFIDKIL